MSDDLGVMVDGFRALIWLNEHSEVVGLGGSCRDCSRFAAALLRGTPPEDLLFLRCATAQAMQRQVDAAITVINRLCP